MLHVCKHCVSKLYCALRHDLMPAAGRWQSRCVAAATAALPAVGPLLDYATSVPVSHGVAQVRSTTRFTALQLKETQMQPSVMATYGSPSLLAAMITPNVSHVMIKQLRDCVVLADECRS
jgi:hypothetical protein